MELLRGSELLWRAGGLACERAVGARVVVVVADIPSSFWKSSCDEFTSASGRADTAMLLLIGCRWLSGATLSSLRGVDRRAGGMQQRAVGRWVGMQGDAPGFEECEGCALGQEHEQAA